MVSSGREDDEDEEGPATEERAQHLADLAIRVRERVGEREWRRLTKLLRIARLATGGWGLALIVAALVCAQLALVGIVALLGRFVSESWRVPPGEVRRGLLYLAVAVGVGGVLLLIDYFAQMFLRRELGQQSGDREEMLEALWARYEIPRIRRKLAERARETAAEARLVEEMKRAPSRWQVELSGAYLIWWLSAAFWLAWVLLRWPVSERLLVSIGVITASGVLFRLIVLGVLRARRQSPSDRLGTLRFYWWWGRGWLPAVLALLPGVGCWVVNRFVVGG